MASSAIVLANDRFQTPNAKVAHGLIRGSERFDVKAVIDPDVAGQDAGELLDGVHRSIPIVSTVDEAVSACDEPPEYCVIGIATHGGRITPELRALVIEAIGKGLSVVNGLHDALSEDDEVNALAKANGVTLTDLRKAKPKHELHFWEGDIYSVRAPRIAVIGTDCAIGKRTTTRMIVQSLNAHGIYAEMIYTGQTGWMQGAKYGFVFDSVINDYVSGELEHAIVSCDKEAKPDVMVLEGQSSLRNPSGPCGAEFLLSGDAKGSIIQFAPGREFFEGYEELGARMPSIESEIELLKFYGSRALAVTLNGKGCTTDELVGYQREYREKLGIPVIRPLEEGLDELVPVIREYINAETKGS